VEVSLLAAGREWDGLHFCACVESANEIAPSFGLDKLDQWTQAKTARDVEWLVTR